MMTEKSFCTQGALTIFFIVFEKAYFCNNLSRKQNKSFEKEKSQFIKTYD